MAGTTTFYGVSYPTSTDLVKDGATAIQTVATGFDSAVAIPTYNAQTGATYTFVLSDTGKTVTASNASAQTYTIPPTASVAWTANTSLNVINLGAGVVTFAAGAGVTVTNTATTLAQFASATLIRTGLNAWTVTPSSGGASGLTLISSTTIGTTVASVTVTGAFSATYDNYLIIMDGSTASSVGNFVSMTLNGSAGSTYNYSGNYHPYGGANVVNTASASTPAYVAQSGADFTTGFNLVISLPFLAKKTTYTSQFATASYAGRIGGYDNNAVSHTAFTIGITSGTLTGGTIRVYGYQNS